MTLISVYLLVRMDVFSNESFQLVFMTKTTCIKFWALVSSEFTNTVTKISSLFSSTSVSHLKVSKKQ
jgi:hypothetical protein